MTQSTIHPHSIKLGNLIINTAYKTVSVPHYWEKDEIVHGRQLHSWGTNYEVDTLINPQTTCLYLLNNQLVFKEYYIPVQEQTKTNSNHYEIEGYNYIKGLYEKEGKFYHLIGIQPTKFVEFEIPKNIDLTKLTYIEGNPYGDRYGYLYDETGLYFLNLFTPRGLSKLAFAKNKQPVMRKFYCEYDGDAFQDGKKIARIDQLTEIDMKRNGETICLTDGKAVFNTYYIQHRELPGMDKWIQITDGNAMVVENNCVYFPPSKEHNNNNMAVFYNVLFTSPDSFVLVDCYLQKELRKIDNVFIKQGDRYEPLDMAKYKLYANGFYAYRDTIYYGSSQIKNNFDMPNLKWLKGTDGWLSDGALLTHRNLLYANKENIIEAESACVPLADAKNLKVVTGKLLFDGINFYQFSNGSIEIIPVKIFWFDIEVISAVSAY